MPDHWTNGTASSTAAFAARSACKLSNMLQHKQSVILSFRMQNATRERERGTMKRQREGKGGATKTDDGETWAHQEGRNLGAWTRAQGRKDAKQGETERGGQFAKVSGIAWRRGRRRRRSRRNRHATAVPCGAERGVISRLLINARARAGAAPTPVNYGCYVGGLGPTIPNLVSRCWTKLRCARGEWAASARRRRKGFSLQSVSLKIVFAPQAALRCGRGEGSVRKRLSKQSLSDQGYPLSPLLPRPSPPSRARPTARARPSAQPLSPFLPSICGHFLPVPIRGSSNDS